ncbi:MAG: succinylglutamate desuccinylase/aspartoacylase family protein, partial [Chloroflexota bacterium]|nr:succinylglutamate desuccinylase/aspartoacylase family protein [Chloroflexota bacterium]
PSLNPAGLRTASRTAYYDRNDPNRTFPTRTPRPEAESPDPPSIFETIARTIWSHVKPSADLLLDLHNASILSVPFIIRDRVLYDGDGDKPRAESLAARLDDLARAFGLSLVNETTPEQYVKRELHRSVAGAAVNEAGIPALTLELGMGIGVDWAAVEAAVQGIENTLVWAGMVDGEIRQPTGVRIVAPDFPTREDDSIRARATGIIEPLLMPGDAFVAGDLLARMVDLWGRPIPESEMRAGADGWLVGWNNNLLKYPGERVALLAVRDDAPLIAPWPDGK